MYSQCLLFWTMHLSQQWKRLRSRILFLCMIIDVQTQSVTDGVGWQVKIGLHQLDNCLSQVRINLTIVNSSCFLPYWGSLASSSSFSRTVHRAHETVSFFACKFAIGCHQFQSQRCDFTDFNSSIMSRLNRTFAVKGCKNSTNPLMPSYSALWFIINHNTCFRFPLVFSH